uniref:Uncharacterized protein n=1 Tax=Mycena chlorophos TaxID=658473 RepID=A0ABQ0LKM8_MYCCL|nr:predicted protein [Mycena chlorophos]
MEVVVGAYVGKECVCVCEVSVRPSSTAQHTVGRGSRKSRSKGSKGRGGHMTMAVLLASCFALLESRILTATAKDGQNERTGNKNQQGDERSGSGGSWDFAIRTGIRTGCDNTVSRCEIREGRAG